MAQVNVLDSTMAYLEHGEGNDVVLLHGNPTSSHLWREVLSEVATVGRALAPDLIGMGRSDKPDIGYRFEDHARYLDACPGARRRFPRRPGLGRCPGVRLGGTAPRTHAGGWSSWRRSSGR